MRCFLFNLLWWCERMRQSARHIYVPHGNEVYVNNWRAWRIREYTIKKILKNRSSRDFFNFIYCVSRGTPRPPFVKTSSGKPRNSNRSLRAVFCLNSNTYAKFELTNFEKCYFYTTFEPLQNLTNTNNVL